MSTAARDSDLRADEIRRIGGSDADDVRRGERGEALRLAFSEFLAGALLFAGAVIALGALTYVFDLTRPRWLEPAHAVLSRDVFVSSEMTTGLLQTIAATVITVASITFSLLLVALQQSASSFTAQVFDQFLRA